MLEGYRPLLGFFFFPFKEKGQDYKRNICKGITVPCRGFLFSYMLKGYITNLGKCTSYRPLLGFLFCSLIKKYWEYSEKYNKLPSPCGVFLLFILKNQKFLAKNQKFLSYRPLLGFFFCSYMRIMLVLRGAPASLPSPLGVFLLFMRVCF